MENHVSQEEIEGVAEEIIAKSPDLLTLEIFMQQKENVHFVHEMPKTDNIPELINFPNINEENENPEIMLSKKINSIDFIYQKNKFVFTRVGAITQDYFSCLFISKDPMPIPKKDNETSKRGLILVVDASGVVFFATCKNDSLNKLNLSLMSCLYPNLN